MKKIKIIAVILLMSVVSALGMETNPYEYYYEYCSSALTSAYSYIPSWFGQSPKESEHIQALRKDKNDFEQELKTIKGGMLSSDSDRLPALFPATWPDRVMCDDKQCFYLPSPIMKSSIKFLQYCYYQKFHMDKSKENMQDLASANFKDLLDAYKEAQIDGYSAIGAAIIAPDVSIESKRNFIEQLIDLGFKPTKKDKMLAELQLYDAISAEKKAEIVAFFSRKDMPYDVTKKIINCMLDLYRKDYWPLPDSANDNK